MAGEFEMAVNEMVVFKSGHVQYTDDQLSNNSPPFKMHLPRKPYFTSFNRVLVFQKALQNPVGLKIITLN